MTEVSVSDLPPANKAREVVCGVSPDLRQDKKETILEANIEIESMKREQLRLGRDFTVVISDFDNSFFGHHDPLRNIQDSKFLRGLLEKHSVPLIIITGSEARTVVQQMVGNGMKPPEIIVAKAGTEIYYLKRDGIPQGSDPSKIVEEHYIRDWRFEEKLRASGFNRLQLAQQAQWLIEENRANSFNFQKPEEEERFMKDGLETDQPYKLSFFFYAQDEKQLGNVLQKVRSWLDGRRLKAGILFCEEVGHNKNLKPGEPKKYCLDLVPCLGGYGLGGYDAVGKLAAMIHLQSCFGPRRGLIVGDSGNDLNMLANPFGTWFLRVVVGGAKRELSEFFEGGKRIGATPFSRLTNDVHPTIIDSEKASNLRPDLGTRGVKYFKDDPSSGRVAAASILEAIRRRLEVSLRFEGDSNNKALIEEIIMVINDYLAKNKSD